MKVKAFRTELEGENVVVIGEVWLGEQINKFQMTLSFLMTENKVTFHKIEF